jgi:cytochrome c553
LRFATAILVSVSVVALAAEAADSKKPDWAYAVPPPAPARAANAASAERPAPDLTPLSIAGSKFQFTRNKVQGAADDGTRTRVQPADWFPEEHPNPIPPIVALGDQSRSITPCSLCHMPEGRGRTENGAIAGLTSAYFIEQMHDFASGARQSAEPLKANAKQMAVFAKAMTEDEIKAAADYYAAIPWVKWTKVVETTTSPKVESHNGLWVPLTGDKAGTEPLGDRIIEVPVDPEATELKRDPHSGYIAYAPVGAVAAGKSLATSGGNGRTMACAGCHGADLMGTTIAPSIAGRTATYIAQQLYDLQAGARNGAGDQPMKPVVAKLDGKDILNLSAYVASLPVPAK